MPRFLVEVPHDEETIVCAQVVATFLRAGSHFLTNADWGCHDGVHNCWLVVEVDSKEEARQILPPPFRADAKITGLTKFSLKKIEAVLREHGVE